MFSKSKVQDLLPTLFIFGIAWKEWYTSCTSTSIFYICIMSSSQGVSSIITRLMSTVQWLCPPFMFSNSKVRDLLPTLFVFRIAWKEWYTNCTSRIALYVCIKNDSHGESSFTVDLMSTVQQLYPPFMFSNSKVRDLLPTLFIFGIAWKEWYTSCTSASVFYICIVNGSHGVSSAITRLMSTMEWRNDCVHHSHFAIPMARDLLPNLLIFLIAWKKTCTSCTSKIKFYSCIANCSQGDSSVTVGLMRTVQWLC